MAVEVFDGTLNTFSVGGNAQLEYLENATMSIDANIQEGASVLYGGSNVQETKRSGRIDCSLFSDVSTGIRVSHLDLSAASLVRTGPTTVNLLSPNILSSLEFNIRMSHQMKAGIGEKFAYPVVTGRTFSASMDLDIETTAGPTLLVDMLSTTYAHRDHTLSFTVNGVVIALPVRIVNAGIPFEHAGKQRFTLQLGDRSGISGSTITPSGTTSLLEKALNAYKTALAFSFQGASAASIALSGNMVWDSYSLRIQDGQLVPSSMSFQTQGTVTGTLVAP
jgi:hypothetical protein